MIPCEFCNEMVPVNGIYNHTSTCPAFLGRYNDATSSSSDRYNRFLLSDVFSALRRNETLDARDEDTHERDAHNQFDLYDELDERIDVRHSEHRRRLRISTRSLMSGGSSNSNSNSNSRPSPSYYSPATALVPMSQSPSYIVPFRPMNAATSEYERNLAIADRLGRVTVAVRNISLVLKPSSTEEPTLCPICQDMCSPLDAVVTVPCNHAYCQHCIAKWLTQSRYCPVCKHEFA